MDRRMFIGALSTGMIAAPLAASAQTATTVRRIGTLSLGDAPTLSELQLNEAPLRELGWIEGKNLLFERKYAGDRPELLRTLADDLVRLRVDVIVTSGTDAAIAAKKATSSIPVIMFSVGDPVLVGLVDSLSRPGGNITGFSIVSTELDAKRLQLLRELLPDIQRVGELVNPNNPIYTTGRRAYEGVYRALRLQPVFVEVRDADELDSAVETVAKQQAQALVVPADNLFISSGARIMRAALRHLLPTVVEIRDLVEAGGLVAYTFSKEERSRRYATYVDKILHGAKPSDLPIQQPTKFELIINMKTAKALGLTIPQALLQRADEVIH
jgi:putative ABC transport system substrate-binding protein